MQIKIIFNYSQFIVVVVVVVVVYFVPILVLIKYINGEIF